MNLRILKSNKDEKAYRKWNQTTADKHLPICQLKQEKKNHIESEG